MNISTATNMDQQLNGLVKTRNFGRATALGLARQGARLALSNVNTCGLHGSAACCTSTIHARGDLTPICR